jgi:WD40 repeat protein
MKFSRNGNTIVALARAITRYLVVVWDIKADTTRVIEDTFFNEKCITLDFNNVLIATDGSQNSRWDTHINSCDIESGVRLCAFLDTKNIFKTFTFSDNTIAVKHNGAYRERISILHASTGGHLRDLTVIENAPGTLKLAFTQNRKLLAALRVCQRELKLCIWDAIEGTLLYTINPPFSSGFEIAFSPNGDVLSCISEHGIIHILDMDTLLTQDNGNAGPLSLVVISPSGKLLVAASDRKLVVWDTSSQDEVQTFKNTSFVTSAILSPDDSKLAWISANKALVSEINRSDSEQLLGHSGSAKCIAFSSDSKIIASGSELSDGSGELSLWDTTTKACLWSFNTYAPVESVALSGDGKTIAVYEEGKGHDAKSWLCDVTNGCHRELKPLFMATVTSLVFSTDDSLLGLAESMPIGDMINLSLWDVSTGKRFKERFQVMVSLSCFALEGTHLTTSRGCAPSNSLAHGPCHGSRQQISTCSGLYVDEQWIYFKGRKCLRFPLNYRPSCVAVFGDLVVLGYDSGGWIWLRFQCAGDEIFEDDHRDYRSWYFECSEERSNPSEVSD